MERSPKNVEHSLPLSQVPHSSTFLPFNSQKMSVEEDVTIETKDEDISPCIHNSGASTYLAEFVYG